MKYLMTIEELKANAVRDLGLMTEGTYAEFMDRARCEANLTAVRRPKLIIGLIYNDQKMNLIGIRQTPYPIAESEWDTLVSQIDEYLESVPHVYLVEGELFTAPI